MDPEPPDLSTHNGWAMTLKPVVTQWGPYLVRQPPLQLVPLLGVMLPLPAQHRLLLLHQALCCLQVGLPLPHSTAQRLLLCAQRVQLQAQL